MKILHLNEHLNWCGGVETYLLTLLPELKARGHEQVVAFAQGQSNLVERSYAVPSLSRSGRAADAEGFRAVEGILQAESPDLVHIHQTFNLGAVKACLGRVPTVVTAHDYRYLCPASTFYFRRTEGICERRCGPGCFAVTLTRRCLTPRPGYVLNYYRRVRWFARNASRFRTVFAPSEYTRGRFLQAGFTEEQVVTLPYFCPIAPLDQPRRAPESPTVLFIGRIRPNKGVRHFIAALGLLPSSVRGLLVGDLTDQWRRDLLGMAVQAGCADRLELRPWANRGEMYDLYQQATILVFPSVWAETLGIVGLEALACGVPAVASDVGGVREWLQDGLTGTLVPPKDPQSLANAITRILQSNGRAQEMGRNGIALIRERFSREQHVERLVALYGDAMQASGIPRRPADALETARKSSPDPARGASRVQ